MINKVRISRKEKICKKITLKGKKFEKKSFSPIHR